MLQMSMKYQSHQKYYNQIKKAIKVLPIKHNNKNDIKNKQFK